MVTSKTALLLLLLLLMLWLLTMLLLLLLLLSLVMLFLTRIREGPGGKLQSKHPPRSHRRPRQQQQRPSDGRLLHPSRH